MQKTIILPFLFAALVRSPAAFAHDAKLHKGKPIEGEVVSVTADQMKLKVESGTQTVALNPETKIEVGDTVAGRNDLRAGQHVSVFGTKLSKSEVVAREVVVHDTGSKGAGQESQDHREHGSSREGP